jgi:hypothetical protein
MKGAAAIAAIAALLLIVPAARAAAPAVGPVSATNIQGVSALLTGTVNPEGLAATYSFQYVDEASFEASGFEGAIATPATTVGSGIDDRPARAAISGLHPDTIYRYRLSAGSSGGSATGTPATFTTTKGFGFLPGEEGFSASVIADGGEVATTAGSHPYQLSLSIGLNLGGEFEGQPGVPFSDGDLRELRITMPPGLIANPAAPSRCAAVDFGTPRVSPFEDSRSGESCPERSQVGTVEVETSSAVRRFGVFNLDPPPGVPAQLGFAPFGAPIVLDADLLADGSHAMVFEAANFPQALDLHGLELTLWGTPWAVSHNGERGNCLNEAEPGFPWAKCSVGAPANNEPLAYLTLPADCRGPIAFAATASSWQQPAEVHTEAVSRDASGQPAPIAGCGSLPFDPHPVGLLGNRRAASASGFTFRLTNDNGALTETGMRIPSPARKAVVKLPEGVTINPSLGAGLGVCTPAQYAAETATGAPGSGCPNQAKIGDFTVRTPLFERWLEGAIYLAEPDDPATQAGGAENPFDSLLAVYLVAKSAQHGVLIKVAGEILADPGTGRLTASFDDLPQLPYTDLEVSFRSGQRAPLVTPPLCGAAATQISVTPWAEALPPAQSSTASTIDAGSSGGPCPRGGVAPFTPGVVAGGVNSNVGSYTPYFVHLSRTDGEQEITSYSLVLPRGITGKLAGIPLCSEAAIAAARTRRGFAEAASPSCPAASQVGHTLSGYGVGSALTYAAGNVYLAGPYHGKPLSLVTVNSATVGPFDLGTIVIRSAFSVDERTAQLAIDSRASDPIPHIIDGIPLHLRDIRVYMDRPQFTRNPTSCEPSELVSALTGSGARFDDPTDDSSVTLRAHFQLLNCLTLGFRPKLGLRLRGGSRRGAYPALRVAFSARRGDANLKRIAVTMPHSLFLAQNHIHEVCTQEQFAADRCPASSIYGRAVAHTPLFDRPLAGPVYLRSSSHRLPDLVASLRGNDVHIVLEGRIGPAKNGIRTFFDDLPDAPIESFVLIMAGGKRGLLVNSSDICAAPPEATVKALGQNNRGAVFEATLRGQCSGPERRSR